MHKIFIMEVKGIFIGKTNDYTFRENIEQNSQVTINKKIEIDGRYMHQVEFENGIIATVEDDELSIIRSKE